MAKIVVCILVYIGGKLTRRRPYHATYAYPLSMCAVFMYGVDWPGIEYVDQISVSLPPSAPISPVFGGDTSGKAALMPTFSPVTPCLCRASLKSAALVLDLGVLDIGDGLDANPISFIWSFWVLIKAKDIIPSHFRTKGAAPPPWGREPCGRRTHACGTREREAWPRTVISPVSIYDAVKERKKRLTISSISSSVLPLVSGRKINTHRSATKHEGNQMYPYLGPQLSDCGLIK